MQNHVMFPDFSAFQIDIPHGHWPHESSSWPGGTYPDPDLYSAFWPDMRARAVTDAGPDEGSGEGSEGKSGSAGSGGGDAAP